MARHGRRNDKGSATLLLEMGADSLCAVGSAIQVDLNNLVPSGRSSINNTCVRSGSGTAINDISTPRLLGKINSIWKFNILGNKGVNLAKVANDLVDAALNIIVVADVELVGLDLDTIVLHELLDVLIGALLS